MCNLTGPCTCMTAADQTPATDSEPTPADWEAGYREQRTHIQKMHQALLSIWHTAEPGDTEYLTFREPDDVVASVHALLDQRNLLDALGSQRTEGQG